MSNTQAADVPSGGDASKRQRALVDTTVQLDQQKYPARRRRIQELLTPYVLKFSTSISLLEFKATIIQECILIHNELRRSNSLFTQVRDRLLEKNHPQVKLRMHIFNNMVSVFPRGSAFETDAKEDRLLAEKARLALENIIPELYQWFADESVDVVLSDRIGCTRAEEAPQKVRVAFETNLPRCRRGVNKNCRVEEAIRDRGNVGRAELAEMAVASEQLQKTIGLIDHVLANANADLSWQQCRGAGDFLICLEGDGKATHALSTNVREWELLAKLFGMEFVRVDYPDDATH